MIWVWFWSFIIAATAVGVIGLVAWVTWRERRDTAREVERVLHEDAALAIVATWHHTPCGCGWANTAPPTIRICTHHWLRLYVAADLHHFDREMSQ